MNNLYKANSSRLFHNLLYIAGCLIAIVATAYFTAGNVHNSYFDKMGEESRMLFISAAMIAFFTIFVPIFTNPEYTDGSIRNKIVLGYTQKQIYLSYLFSHFTAAFVMWLFYMAGGIIGGARPTGKTLIANFVILFAVFSYISFLLIISLRLKKMVVVAILSILALNVSYTSVMFGNALLTITEGTSRKIGAIIYNISSLGQWFSNSGFADDFTNPGLHIQLIISLVIILLTTAIGTLAINKRDLA